MDSELVSLASSGATTVVALLATDGWEEAKSAVSSLWRRVHPDRVETIVAELIETRSALLTARAVGDEQAAPVLVGEWQSRLSRLLAGCPELAGELRRVVADELGPALAEASSARTTIEMHAHAFDQGRIYQAARDLHITEG